MISVIVPVYNSEKYIEQCIQSILAQSYTNLEIILIDDCSDDQSLHICQAYAAKDNRIRILCNSYNHGQVYSYTKGIKNALGEFIAFVDSDDWIAPTMISKLYYELHKKNADIAVCGCWQVYPDKKILEPSDIQCIGMKCFCRQEIIHAAEIIHTPTNIIDHIIKLYRCNKLFKKQLLLDNLQYIQTEVRVFEDNNIVIPCLLDAEKVVYINQPLYYYRRSHNSTMSLFNEEILCTSESFLANQEYIFQDKGLPHNVKSDAYVVCAYMINCVLKSNISWSKKVHYLHTVADWIEKYDIILEEIQQYGASKKFSTIFWLIAHKHYKISIALGLLYNYIKK